MLKKSSHLITLLELNYVNPYKICYQSDLIKFVYFC